MASAQSLVEHSAAAAGGAIGGVAGKKVSDALTNIFEKVDKTATKAATADKPKRADEPLFDVGPGVPHATAAAPTPTRSERRSSRSGLRSDVPSVPPPPPLARHTPRRRAPVETSEVAQEPVPAPEPPPPPSATPEDLKKIAIGERRSDVVKMGFPAIHIMMYDNGHLLETYLFMSDSSDIGSVHLTDGTVSSVQVH